MSHSLTLTHTLSLTLSAGRVSLTVELRPRLLRLSDHWLLFSLYESQQSMFTNFSLSLSVFFSSTSRRQNFRLAGRDHIGKATKEEEGKNKTQRSADTPDGVVNTARRFLAAAPVVSAPCGPWRRRRRGRSLLTAPVTSRPARPTADGSPGVRRGLGRG